MYVWVFFMADVTFVRRREAIYIISTLSRIYGEMRGGEREEGILGILGKDLKSSAVCFSWDF